MGPLLYPPFPSSENLHSSTVNCNQIILKPIFLFLTSYLFNISLVVWFLFPENTSALKWSLVTEMIEKLNFYPKKSTFSAYTLLPTKIDCFSYLKRTSVSHFQYLLFDYSTTVVFIAFLNTCVPCMALCALQILSHLIITKCKEVDIIISVYW